MSFGIILLILLAALLHASWNAVIKGGSNKLYETGLNCFGGGVGVLFIVPFLPFPGRLLYRPYRLLPLYRRSLPQCGHVVRLYHHARHGPAPDIRFHAPFRP